MCPRHPITVFMSLVVCLFCHLLLLCLTLKFFILSGRGWVIPVCDQGKAYTVPGFKPRSDEHKASALLVYYLIGFSTSPFHV